MRAVIYARISEDHERAESVPTQIANGTKYAERMGWEVVRVFKARAGQATPARFGPASRR
jgi:DNA invertase Pin-like site-specific DNA recombinase